MKISQFFVFGLSPIDYSEDFTKAFFLGLPNPQNCFVFCFKVDLDLAEIQNHVLLKNASKNGITELLPDLEPEKPESESQLSVLSHFHPKYFPS